MSSNKKLTAIIGLGELSEDDMLLNPVRRRADKWVLREDRVPVPARSLEEWAMFFDKAENRLVAKTVVSPNGRTGVSSVFLGLDHNWCPEGGPVLFETMIFGGPLNEYCRRSRTWTECEEEHRIAVRRARTARLLGWIPGFRRFASRWGWT